MNTNFLAALLLALAVTGYSQARHPVQVARETAKPKVYVALFSSNGSIDAPTVSRITDDFESILFTNHCYELIDRKNVDDLLRQLRNERQLYSIRDFEPRVKDLLKFEHATAVVFGQIDDDIKSGDIILRVKTESFDSRILATGSGRIRRGVVNDHDNRITLVKEALNGLCGADLNGPRPESTQTSAIDGFLFKLDRCLGGTTSVECFLTITNQKPDDRGLSMTWQSSSIIDSAGIAQGPRYLQIGSSRTTGCCFVRTELLNGIPVKASIGFGGVASNVTSIGRLRLAMDGQGGFTVDFRNVPLSNR